MKCGVVLRTLAVAGALAGTAAAAAHFTAVKHPTSSGPALRAEVEAPPGASFVRASGPSAPLPDRAAAGAITFGQPTIAGIQGTGFEPDLRIDPHDTSTLYASVPAFQALGLDGSRTWLARAG